MSPAEEPPNQKKKKKTSQHIAAVDLPATPATDAEKMDSDDEFNSSLSGGDFDDLDSDMSLEEGTGLSLESTCSTNHCL